MIYDSFTCDQTYRKRLLEYGKRYVQRNSEITIELKPSGNNQFPFLGSNGRVYDRNGNYFADGILSSDLDLIKEYKAEPMTSIEQAKKEIKSASEALARAQEKLREAEEAAKPKIRHGDYGYRKDTKEPRLWLVGGLDVQLYGDVWRVAEYDLADSDTYRNLYVIMGNIFDDIKSKQ